MAFIGPKPWANHFAKMSIFRLFELLFFIAQKGVFSFQNIVKDNFCALYCLKKKVGKMAFFGQKAWVNSFGKMSISRLFELLILQPRKGFFYFQNIVKDIFLTYIANKKKLEKWPFLDKNDGLTPLEKCQFFDFLNFFFFIAQKGVFSFQNIVKDVFLAYIAN